MRLVDARADRLPSSARADPGGWIESVRGQASTSFGLRLAVAAALIASWPIAASGTAHAATYGCHTYVDFVWQADDWAHQNSVGQSYSYTFASAASDPNDACSSTYGYAVRAGTWQEVWTGSAWQYCAAGYGNRSYSWHTAWFAGNPWSDVTPWLVN